MSTDTKLPKVPEILIDRTTIGVNTTVNNDGSVSASISVNKATSNSLGVVKPDGNTITIDNNGVISVNTNNITATNITLEDGSSIQDAIEAIQQTILDEEEMANTEY